MTADQLSQLLDELGKRLGPTGSHVFELAVRQQVINGVMLGVASVVALVVVTLGLALLAYGWRKGSKVAAEREANPPKRDPYRYGQDDLPGTGEVIVGFCVAVVAILSGLYFVIQAVPLLLNPEYAALKDILGAVHP